MTRPASRAHAREIGGLASVHALALTGMPIDVSTPKFLCEICREDYPTYTAAAACEHQGVEAEPLPAGTQVLAIGYEHTGTQSQTRPIVAVHEITEHTVGSGKFSHGQGHQVKYQLSKLGAQDTVRGVRPHELYPHAPGQLNTTISGLSFHDGRNVGERLERIAHWQGGSQRRVELDEALGALDVLLGRPAERELAELAFQHSTQNPHGFRHLRPRAELAPETLALIDACARPLRREDIDHDVDWRNLRFYQAALGGEGGYRLPQLERGAFSLLAERSDFWMPALTCALLAATREELLAAAITRSQQWWAGEPVLLPVELLCAADGPRRRAPDQDPGGRADAGWGTACMRSSTRACTASGPRACPRTSPTVTSRWSLTGPPVQTPSPASRRVRRSRP